MPTLAYILRVEAAYSDKFAEKNKDKINDRLVEDHGHSQFLDQIHSQPGGTKEEKVVNHLLSHDPTPQNKYRDWITSRYLKGGIRHIEDLPRVREALDIHSRHAVKDTGKEGTPIHKDIGRYKTLPELEAHTAAFSKKSRSQEDKDREQNFFDKKSATLVHDSPTYQITEPKTMDASRYFGRNTKWCTTHSDNSMNMLPHYRKQGPLFYMLHKPSGKRFAIHDKSKNGYDGVDIYNPEDNMVDPEDFEHKEALNHITKMSLENKKLLGLKLSPSESKKLRKRIDESKKKVIAGEDDGDYTHANYVTTHGHVNDRHEIFPHANFGRQRDIIIHAPKEHTAEYRNHSDPDIRFLVAKSSPHNEDREYLANKDDHVDVLAEAMSRSDKAAHIIGNRINNREFGDSLHPALENSFIENGHKEHLLPYLKRQDKLRAKDQSVSDDKHRDRKLLGRKDKDLADYYVNKHGLPVSDNNIHHLLELNPSYYSDYLEKLKHASHEHKADIAHSLKDYEQIKKLPFNSLHELFKSIQPAHFNQMSSYRGLKNILHRSYAGDPSIYNYDHMDPSDDEVRDASNSAKYSTRPDFLEHLASKKKYKHYIKDRKDFNELPEHIRELANKED